MSVLKCGRIFVPTLRSGPISSLNNNWLTINTISLSKRRFVGLAAFTVIGWIPRGALFGLLLYLGMGALHGNEIWERAVFCLMPRKKRPPVPVVTEVPWRRVQVFTLIQIACAGAIFAVANFTSVGYIYPVLLVLLVPIRSYILVRCFTAHDLKHLDPHGEDEEDKEGYIEEQRVVHTHQPSSDSADSLEDVPGNRAEFRGQGGGKNLRRRGLRGSSDNDDSADAGDVEGGGRGERTFSFNNS